MGRTMAPTTCQCYEPARGALSGPVESIKIQDYFHRGVQAELTQVKLLSHA